MTNDPVEAVIAAYLDHLEHGAPEPSLDHLGDDDRHRAIDLMDLMRDGRGIDVYRSRPSLDALLSGTEFEGWADAPDTDGLTIDAVRAEVISSLGSASSPIADGTAENEGVRSDALVRFGTLHFRIQFRDDLHSPSDLAAIDPRAAAGPIFGRFPETAVVIAVIGDDQLSSVGIDIFDTEDFIGSPDGRVYPARVSRPVLTLFDTLRLLADELAPDLTGEHNDSGRMTVDATGIIEAECAGACSAIVDEGRKSRTEAKKEEWTHFDRRALLISIAHDAATDRLDADELARRIDAAAVAA